MQNGSANTPAKLYLGCGTGSKGAYSLSATGQLGAGYEFLRLLGHGKFRSDGRRQFSLKLPLSRLRRRHMGKYTLGGTGSLAACPEFVGYWGTGSFTQTAGTNTVARILCLGQLRRRQWHVHVFRRHVNRRPDPRRRGDQ